MVLWTRAQRSVLLLLELALLREVEMDGACERSRAKYSNLAAECRENGWNT